jgi:radical SAM protein with 4Fe4S-binding SPASM domain
MKCLEITSYVGCENNCCYCPQDKLINVYQDKCGMSLMDFIDILANVPKDVRIDFSGFSEIFLHPEGAHMIAHSIHCGYKTVLYTTLVGFCNQDIQTLKGLHFTEVVFHQFPGVDVLGFNRKKEIFKKEIQDGRTAEITDTNLWSRAGNVFNTERKYGEFACLFAGKEFNHNVVLPNGDVYICCMDWSLKHKIGNLFTTNFNDLNRSGLVEMSNEIDTDILCRNCELFQKL